MSTVLSDAQRHRRAFLDDMLQSLRAPLQYLAELLGRMAESSAISGEGGFLSDVQRIASAVVAMENALRLLEGDSCDDAVLSRVRHDLRNSIGVVDGYAEMLGEDCDDELVQSLLVELHKQSRAFQVRLEQLRFTDTLAATGDDPIAGIFRSFKRGLKPTDQTFAMATILVADDNDSARELLAQQLQRRGYIVLEASGGKSCLEAMRRAEPDLLLLDLVMPDMNGYEVLRVVRADEKLRRIPVVVVSGIQDEDGAIHCIEAGASDYLLKPVNATLLNARLSALLERKRWQDRERDYLSELEKSQRFIRKIFGRYLSDEVVQRLLDDQDGLELGGQRREVTVLMADIRDFSIISQQLEPEKCVALLNNYLGVMAELIQRYRGTVDELMGDGILAIFGAPVSEPDDCDRALACAVAMQLGMAEVNKRNREQGLPQISVGIGLNTGDVVAGNIGSERRSKYGVVGHNVNLTARVEACTVGGQILITPATQAAAQASLLLGDDIRVSLKGVEDALCLRELRGIGLPYDLVLENVEADFRSLLTPLSLQLILMSNKRLGDQHFTVVAQAVSGDALIVVGPEGLSLPADVGIDGLTERRLFGKLFDMSGERYRLVVSSGLAGLELQ